MCTVRLLIKLNPTVTYRLSPETAWLTSKHYLPPDDGGRDGLRNVGLLSTTDTVCCTRRIYWVQSPWKLLSLTRAVQGFPNKSQLQHQNTVKPTYLYYINFFVSREVRVTFNFVSECTVPLLRTGQFTWWTPYARSVVCTPSGSASWRRRSVQTANSWGDVVPPVGWSLASLVETHRFVSSATFRHETVHSSKQKWTKKIC
jgi:hypothetical protein